MTERLKIAPIVRLIEGVFVIGPVGSVELGGPMSRNQRMERSVEEGGVVLPRPQAARMGQHTLVDGRADSLAWHAMNVAWSCH